MGLISRDRDIDWRIENAETAKLPITGEERKSSTAILGRNLMKALTIKQPWVYAILHDGKDVENRSWKPRFKGWIAIHAAKEPRRNAAFPRGHTIPDLKSLDYSAIVAIAHVLEFREFVRSKWFYVPPKGEINYGWILDKVRPLRAPIPCRGALQLWNVPTPVAAKIQREFPKIDFSNEIGD